MHAVLRAAGPASKKRDLERMNWGEPECATAAVNGNKIKKAREKILCFFVSKKVRTLHANTMSLLPRPKSKGFSSRCALSLSLARHHPSIPSQRNQTSFNFSYKKTPLLLLHSHSVQATKQAQARLVAIRQHERADNGMTEGRAVPNLALPILSHRSSIPATLPSSCGSVLKNRSAISETAHETLRSPRFLRQPLHHHQRAVGDEAEALDVPAHGGRGLGARGGAGGLLDGQEGGEAEEAGGPAVVAVEPGAGESGVCGGVGGREGCEDVGGQHALGEVGFAGFHDAELGDVGGGAFGAVGEDGDGESEGAGEKVAGGLGGGEGGGGRGEDAFVQDAVGVLAREQFGQAVYRGGEVAMHGGDEAGEDHFAAALGEAGAWLGGEGEEEVEHV